MNTGSLCALRHRGGSSFSASCNRRLGLLLQLKLACFVLVATFVHWPLAAAQTCDNDVLTSEFYGDAYCDLGTEFNTAACGWDGGDCCRQSCESTDFILCGDNGYECIDPAYSNGVEDFTTITGGLCDDAGPDYCTIPTQFTCEYAANLLGLSDTNSGTIQSSASRVPGCYVTSSNQLRFNSMLDSTTEAGSSTTAVCIKCDSITTSTTTTTTTNRCNIDDCKDMPLYQCSLHECRFTDSIRLASKSLTGTIPSAIGLALGDTLTSTLRLDGNKLTGTIPPSLASLTALDTLYLIRNKLTGLVPSSLCGLVTNLGSCWISYTTQGSESNDYACPRPAACKAYLEAPVGTSGCGLGDTCGTDAVDCDGAWTEWACPVSCGGGRLARSFNVAQLEYNGGTPCEQSNGDLEQQGANTCGTDACPTTTTQTTTTPATTTVVTTTTVRTTTTGAYPFTAFTSFTGGYCSDSAGFCTIRTEELCETAAATLGLSDVTAGAADTSTRVAGCYLTSTGNLKLNTALDSTSDAGSDTNVCIDCSYLGTTTGAPSVPTTAAATTGGGGGGTGASTHDGAGGGSDAGTSSRSTNTGVTPPPSSASSSSAYDAATSLLPLSLIHI